MEQKKIRKSIFEYVFILLFFCLGIGGFEFAKIPLAPFLYPIDLLMFAGVGYLIFRTKSKRDFQLLFLRIKSYWLYFSIGILYFLKAILAKDGAFIIIVKQASIIIYAFYFVIFYFFLREFDIKRMIRMITTLVAIKLIYVLIISGSDIINALTQVNERVRFNDRTSIALMFLIFPILLLKWNDLKTWQKGVLFTFLIMELFLVFHRTMWIGLFIEYIFISKLQKKNFIKLIRTAFPVIILTGILVAVLPYGRVITKMFASAATLTEDHNTFARMGLSFLVVDDATKRLEGNGFGKEYKFTLLDLGLDVEMESVYYGLHHNSYLTVLYFLGWIPFVLILYFIFKTLRIPWRMRGKLSDETIIYSGAFMGLSLFASFNLVLEAPYYSIYFWMFAAGIYASFNKRRGNTTEQGLIG